MSRTKKLFAPRRLTAMAIFIALQIVLARFAGFYIFEGLRVSLEAIPIILASIWIGPVAGLLVGFLSDLVGTLIGGVGVYFPPIAITPILMGVLPGLIYRYIYKENMNLVKCVVMVFAAEIIASLLYGSLALTWYFALFVPNKQMTYQIMFMSRLLPKLVTMSLDTLIVWLVHRTAYKRAIAPIIQGHKGRA